MKVRPFRPALETLEARLTPTAVSVVVQLTQDSIEVQRNGATQVYARSGITQLGGTQEDERYEIRLTAGAFTDLRIDGGSGNDTVTVLTSDETDLIQLSPRNGSVAADSYALTLANFASIT